MCHDPSKFSSKLICGSFVLCCVVKTRTLITSRLDYFEDDQWIHKEFNFSITNFYGKQGLFPWTQPQDLLTYAWFLNNTNNNINKNNLDESLFKIFMKGKQLKHKDFQKI
jgi:hypothetical protein